MVWWDSHQTNAHIGFEDDIVIQTDDPNQPITIPCAFLLNPRFDVLLNQVFDYANRPPYPGMEADLTDLLGLSQAAERVAILELYRRLREYIESGRNHVWHWYISNLVQPIRLTANQPSRLIGNPPWVVYNAMAADRQDKFRRQAALRDLWAGANLATQNDLAATFVATCVDYYLEPGGRFGFVLPYAALKARHWAPFRTGKWSPPEHAGRGRVLADLSKDAWDFFAVNNPPFPQANSSAVFGQRLDTTNPAEVVTPVALSDIQQVGNIEPVHIRMPWDKVKPLLTFTRQKQWPTAPSPAYAVAFRNGATLFPQSLVIFEKPNSQALGTVYFNTNPAKGAWQGTNGEGQVERQFIKQTVFSRLLLPFGTNGHSHIIAPFAADGASLLETLPKGSDSENFRQYWDIANRKYREHTSGRPPNTLTDRVDWLGNLSAQLGKSQPAKVIYNASGNNLVAAIIGNDQITSHSTYWAAFDDPDQAHYLSAILNAGCLQQFFREACRASDRGYMLLPVQNLPIPAFDAGNEHHANLATQSQLAHQRVAALVAEQVSGRRKINRNDVLRDGAMQPILAAIDQAVQAILPDYCS